MKTSLLLLASLILCGSVLKAGVIYSNFGQPGDTYDSGTGLQVSSDTALFDIGVGFTPSANYSLTQIRFVASSLDPSSLGNVVLAIYDSSAGHPGNVLESFAINKAQIGTLGQNPPIITVNSVLNPLLGAGSEYWAVLSNSAESSLTWNSGDNAFFGGVVQRSGGNWTDLSTYTQGALEVSGEAGGSVVPEPATYVFGLSGLGLIAAWRRQRA